MSVDLDPSIGSRTAPDGARQNLVARAPVATRTVRRGGRYMTVRGWLIALAIGSVLPVLAFALFLQFRAFQEHVDSTAQRTLTLAHTLSISVARELQGNVTALTVMSKEPSLQLDHPDIKVVRSRAEAIADAFPGAEILLLRRDGQQLMNTRLPLGAPLPQRSNLDTLNRVVATGRPAVSGIHRASVTDRYLVTIDVPVKRPDGSVIYVLSIHPPLGTFQRILQRADIPEGWIATVLDVNSIIVARTVNAELYVGQHSALSAADPSERQLEKHLSEGISLEGIRVIRAYSRVPPFDWAVGIGIPRDQLVAPAIADALHAILVGLCMLTISVGCAIYAASRISKPIASLRRLALERGDDQPLAPEHSGLHEVDDVADVIIAADADRQRARQQLEQMVVALKQNELRLLHAQHIAHLAFFTRNIKTKEVFWSSEMYELFGLPSAMKPDDSNFDRFIHPDDVYMAQKAREIGAEGVSPPPLEYRIVRADGGVRHVYRELEVVLDEAGAPNFLLGVLQDVTERRQTERYLQDLQSELLHVSRLSTMGQMASTLAHELNQPLSALTSYLQGLKRLTQGQFDPARVVDVIDRAVAQASRAGEVIRRLREFVAKGDTDRQAENLNSVVEEAVALALVGARQSGIVPSLRFAPNLPPVLMDKVQIQQVVLNLVRNAIEAMAESEQRELTVATVLREASLAEIVVADTGPGIAPEVAERLFQPFTTTKKTGMGVGLSICREIVEAHGGHIVAAANTPRGTVFRVTLPIVAGGPGDV